VLGSIPLFSGLTAEALKAVEQHSAVRSFRRNTVVIQKGDESTILYAVVSGRLKVTVSDDQGKEVILNTLGPGDYFGELAIFGESPRTASVVTLEDAKLLAISRVAFLDAIREQPDIALAVIRGLAERVAQLTEQVGRLALGDVYSRVRDTVMGHAVEEEGRLVTGRFTQSEIAQMVGSSREMVSRIFKDLREGGYISLEDKRVVILKKLPARW
jgi:CRP/FNR family cyclic AMP-dependent transcriptional regulator